MLLGKIHKHIESTTKHWTKSGKILLSKIVRLKYVRSYLGISITKINSLY